ncbi:MAG: hypothetical protein R3B51_07095 [Thermodesulfobacteriota bacterium]
MPSRQGRHHLRGDLDLNAVLTSSVGESGFFNSLRGTIDLTSSDGWVEKYGSMARFFAILNFGDLFRGRGRISERRIQI